MRRIFALVLVSIVGIAAGSSAGRADPIDPFVGHWQGRGITENGAPAESVGFIDRELDVTVEKTEDGFRVTWATRRQDVRGASDKVKYTSVSVPFDKVDAPGIYRMSATSEPLSGSPYIWARVADNVLEVHSITISQRGILEYQKYVRTLLNDNEMQLRFTRSVDGSIVRSVLAHLNRR